MNIYKHAEFEATVTETNYVEVRKNGVLIDNPGPWGDYEGARAWAEVIVGKLASDNTTPE